MGERAREREWGRQREEERERERDREGGKKSWKREREMTEMNSYYPAGREGNEGRSEQGPQIVARAREIKDRFCKRQRDGWQASLFHGLFINLNDC